MTNSNSIKPFKHLLVFGMILLLIINGCSKGDQLELNKHEVQDIGTTIFQENFDSIGQWNIDTSFQELFYPYETSLPSHPRPVILENGILSLTSWIYWYPNEEVPVGKNPPVPLRKQPSNLTINFETPIIASSYRVDLKILYFVPYYRNIPLSIHDTHHSGGTNIWIVLNGKKYDLTGSHYTNRHLYENETFTYILDTNEVGEKWPDEKNSFNIDNSPFVSSREGASSSSPCIVKIDNLRIAALN